MCLLKLNILRNNKELLEKANSDLEKRVAAEISLRTSEKKYRTLFENLTVGFALYNLIYDENELPLGVEYIEVNSTYEALMGKRFAFAEGEEGKRLRHVGNFEYLHIIDRVLKTGISESLEFFYKSRYLNIWLYRPDEGLVAALMSDITDRVTAQNEIENAHALVKYIINSLPISIITIDKNQNVTQCNKSAEVFISPKDREFYSNSLFEKFRMLNFIEYELNISIKNNSTITNEKIVSKEEGESRIYNVLIMPIAAPINEGSLIIIEDITEKKSMEELMIQSEKMTSIAGLAAGIAHEINNPLGTIAQGCQNIIRRTDKEMPRNKTVAQKIGIEMEQIEEYFKQREINNIIDSIGSAAGKASGIIKNMLQFSRKGDSGKNNCAINKLLDDTIALIKNDYNLNKKYDFKNIRIETQYEENLFEIWISAVEIQQVIFNLIQNSVQAIATEKESEKIPVIIVRTKREEDNLIIEIEDNGPGMDEKTKHRIFEPFFTTKAVGEGTGLGLSVSYMIIKNNHIGKISVNSHLGNGTTFQIILPSVIIIPN